MFIWILIVLVILAIIASIYFLRRKNEGYDFSKIHPASI